MATSTSKIYFIVTCGRSGSTSLSKVLDTATNGICLSEPALYLDAESRDLMEGRLPNPREVLAEKVFPRMAKALDQGMIYGEKHLTFGPFIPYLYEMIKCKFLFLIRDGRDVVTSFMNWHNEVYGTVYRECKEEGNLSENARKMLDLTPIEKDLADYSRPRPGIDDPFYMEWPEFSRFEMVSWYWNYMQKLFVRNLSLIPQEDWMMINYTGISSEAIESAFSFLGLEGFDKETVNQILESRINNVQYGLKVLGASPQQNRWRDRIGLAQRKDTNRFPEWQKWDKKHQQQFDRIASDMMKTLGYYK